MVYTYAAYSDIGKRSNNEDSFNIVQCDDSIVIVVADGLGGHANGEVASKIASECIPLSLSRKTFDEDELGLAIFEANDRICKTNSSSCTTVTSLWLKDSSAIAAHVGDSRIYQFRDGKVVFQSEDHSMVQVEISLGKLSPNACRYHKERNKVYRVLGEDNKTPAIDMCELSVLPGDCFLLCTDGFWEPVTEDEMLATLAISSTPETWLEAMASLIRKANNAKQDNHTAVVIFANP